MTVMDSQIPSDSGGPPMPPAPMSPQDTMPPPVPFKGIANSQMAARPKHPLGKHKLQNKGGRKK